MVPQSMLHISGRSSATWARRSTGPTMSVPGPGIAGSCALGTQSPPMPLVRLITTSVSLARTRSTASRNSAGSRLPLPVSGSRTWMWAIAAPARAASMAASATCSGVTGTPGCLPVVSPAPVTAQVTTTS